MNPRNPIPARNAQPEEGGDHFAAPLGSSRSGRLRFMNGAHQIVIRTDPRERSLYLARFGSRTPTVGVQGGVVSVWREKRTRLQGSMVGGASTRSTATIRGARHSMNLQHGPCHHR